jgi:hypothetical protein
LLEYQDYVGGGLHKLSQPKHLSNSLMDGAKMMFQPFAIRHDSQQHLRGNPLVGESES